MEWAASSPISVVEHARQWEAYPLKVHNLKRCDKIAIHFFLLISYTFYLSIYMNQFTTTLVDTVIYTCITTLAFTLIHTIISGISCLLSKYTFVECFQSDLFMFSIVVLFIFFFFGAFVNDQNNNK